MNEGLERGARNLLSNCARVRPGERVLLVGESGPAPFFDARLCDDLAQVCAGLGIDAQVLLAEPVSDASRFPAAVSEAMQTADVTVFLSRLGDQVRFLESPGAGRKVMCYTLTREHMASSFAGVDYRLMRRLHDHLLDKLTGAAAFSFEAANGTSLTATSSPARERITEFSLELFPVMIFPPLNFAGLNGQLVLEHFLLSTSTRAYADSALLLDTPVTARIEDTRMVDFDGAPGLVMRLRQQLERAASITGGDPYRLNSWHTGINPYTFFDGDPFQDLERWGTVAYGSPRYTHIHACGNDPGDISIQLFDASIALDGETLWHRGRFSFLDSAEVQALLAPAERKLLNASVRLDIGL